jgi:signal transduction histidine kinase
MRVLIVDDHAMVRRSVRESLERALGPGEFGEAGGAAEGLRLVREQPWEVVLLDLSLPDGRGLETLREIRALRPGLPVLVMSMHPEKEYGPAARAAGAADYLMKGSDPQVIAAAVRSALPPKPSSGPAHDLGELAMRSESSREDERHRLARALHDDVGQVLTAVKINLQMARTAEDPEEVRRRAAEGVELLDGAIASVRRLTARLRPPLLDELGLVPALQAFVAGLEDEATTVGLTLALDAPMPAGPPRRGAPELEIAAFRIVEEAVTNVLRHAHAAGATVTVLRDRQRLRIAVCDDGQGFDVAAATGGGRLGLVSIRERVRALGGVCQIESSAETGTVVRVELPEGENKAS